MPVQCTITSVYRPYPTYLWSLSNVHPSFPEKSAKICLPLAFRKCFQQCRGSGVSVIKWPPGSSSGFRSLLFFKIQRDFRKKFNILSFLFFKSFTTNWQHNFFQLDLYPSGLRIRVITKCRRTIIMILFIGLKNICLVTVFFKFKDSCGRGTSWEARGRCRSQREQTG